MADARRSRRDIDPARARRQPGDAPRVDRKMQQLCAQIRRVLDMTLAGDFDDEVLQNMSVQSVTPAPGSRATVVFLVHPPGSLLDRHEVLARLDAARPRLIEEVARSVERRSLPELSFWVVREGETPPEPTPR